jgi:catechol 2,3-dioxygenase-like lactoylglutathione lyase family enzyme
MLAKSEAFSGFSVPDLEAAKKFYGDTLGVEVAVEDPPGILILKLGGGTNVFAYPKENHEAATFTILNFPVENIKEAVAELTKRGVSFERYEGFEQDENGIAWPEKPEYGPPIAWFKDPAGNILSVLEQ